MASFAGDFDDVPEDELSSPPLPPEDRLWRHPSELGSGNLSLPLDAVALRRRWLNQQPSRASAWTAGLVGAILATGLVALGTHLAGAFTGHSAPGATQSAGRVTAPTEAVPAPVGEGLGTTLGASIARAGSSVAVVDVMHGTVDQRCLALVIRSDGALVAPDASVRGATTLLVTLANAVPYVASLVASDPRSGLAILHINGASALPTLQMSSAGELTQQSFAVAVTAPGGSSYALGAVQALDLRAEVGGEPLTDVVATDVAAAKAPPGSALIDAEGGLTGMVVGAEGGKAVVVPAWVIGPVVDQLLADGRLSHGALGVEGRSVAAHDFAPAGVLLTAVTPGSAAGEAGLRVGDIVTSLDFQPITSMTGLQGHLYGMAPGQEVVVGVERGTSDLFYEVHLQPEPSTAPAKVAAAAKG